jgi:DNA-binding MarR family transcriptional regulator
MTDSLTPPGSWPGPAELGATIWRAQRAIERAVDAWLAPLDLPTPVFRLLRLLHHEPGQSAADLARRLGFAPQSVALAIGQGERAGLVERRPHPVHGRIRQLFLTAPGQAAYQRAVRVVGSFEHELAADLDPDAAGLLWRQLVTLAEHADRLGSRLPAPR